MKRLSLLVLLVGCNKSPATMDMNSPLDMAATEGDMTPAVVVHSTLTTEAAAAARQSCNFAAGALPAVSIAKEAPLGSEIPIDHVLILMLENRSFDHMLANLPAYGQPDADVAPSTSVNFDRNGLAVNPYHLDEYCLDDPEHGWDKMHAEWDDGKNDGFVIANQDAMYDPLGHRAMGYYTEKDLPFFYWLASEFALGDRYFCATLGPTYPNRLFLYAGTSFGHTGNPILPEPLNNVMELLEANKVPWHVYSQQVPGPAILLDSTAKYFNQHFDVLNEFFVAAKNGKLDQVVFLDPDVTGNARGLSNDFHPPADPQLGEQLLAQLVDAVTSSPDWAHTALFITFDESGGFFDHVPPPKACPPDSIPPDGVPMSPGFDRYGFRVPLMVVSPYAKAHFVSHDVYDPTSILRFIEARFTLPALTARDANADPMLNLFDFQSPPRLTVAKHPDVVIDEDKKNACAMRFPAMTH